MSGSGFGHAEALTLVSLVSDTLLSEKTLPNAREPLGRITGGNRKVTTLLLSDPSSVVDLERGARSDN
jgi:hypothetical protein